MTYRGWSESNLRPSWKFLWSTLFQFHKIIFFLIFNLTDNCSSACSGQPSEFRYSKAITTVRITFWSEHNFDNNWLLSDQSDVSDVTFFFMTKIKPNYIYLILERQPSVRMSCEKLKLVRKRLKIKNKKKIFFFINFFIPPSLWYIWYLPQKKY